MIPWWVAVVALFAGACFGVLAAALMAAGSPPFDRCDDPDCPYQCGCHDPDCVYNRPCDDDEEVGL